MLCIDEQPASAMTKDEASSLRACGALADMWLDRVRWASVTLFISRGLAAGGAAQPVDRKGREIWRCTAPRG
jgi:hypothetical protein